MVIKVFRTPIAVTRKGWISNLLHKPKKRKVTMVIVHHTYKPDLAMWKANPKTDLEKGAYFWKVIDRFHRSKGWNGIGYHGLITPDGLIWLGRDINEVGAHTQGKNGTSIGLCLLGNFDIEYPTSEQWATLKWALAATIYAYKLTVNDIHFHREFANKSCPGYHIQLTTLREAVERTLKDAIPIFKQLGG